MKQSRSASTALDGGELEARRRQRLTTRALLEKSRTPLTVLQAVETAAELADAAIRTAAEQHPPRPPLACRAGCAWCCHKLVGTAAPEVLRIARFVRETFSEEDVAAVRDRADRLDEQRRSLTDDPWVAERLPCPLLLADGRCSVYPVRPLTCRGYNSSDARRCEESVTSREHVTVPKDQVQLRLGTFILDGLSSGVAEAGLAGDRLELTAALRVALTVPDAAERWLRGEPVFAAARLPGRGKGSPVR
jgi:Fe-S-cluster containining protein